MRFCDHCQKRPAKINTGISKDPQKSQGEYRCLVCYSVEQQMAGTEDWRDTSRLAYMQNNDMTQRPEETPANLHNRCKRLVMQSGFKVGGHS